MTRVTFSDWQTRIELEEAERMNRAEWNEDPRLILTHEDLEEACKPRPDPERSKVVLWILGAAVVTVGVTIAAVASASTLQPQYDDTGRPFFTVEGPECWTEKHGGEPMDCAEIDKPLYDVPRLIDGRMETPAETYARTGSYQYSQEVSAVPLPGAAWLLAGALGMLAARKVGD